MIEAVRPLGGQPVEVRGPGRLQGRLPVERLDGAIPQPIQKYQKTFVGQMNLQPVGWLSCRNV
ncbi:MAG: hypothetical protein P8Z70_03210 [Desulfuromonadales bacterium]|jgi:hypothetical protein